MIETFILNRSPTKSSNEMLSANDRFHFRKVASLTKQLRRLAYYQTKKPSNPFSKENPCLVIVTIHPPTKKRMDPPNWYPTIKALLDGMVDRGVFTDDNSDVIKQFTFEQGDLYHKPNTYKITITVKEITYGM